MHSLGASHTIEVCFVPPTGNPWSMRSIYAAPISNANRHHVLSNTTMTRAASHMPGLFKKSTSPPVPRLPSFCLCRPGALRPEGIAWHRQIGRLPSAFGGRRRAPRVQVQRQNTISPSRSPPAASDARPSPLVDASGGENTNYLTAESRAHPVPCRRGKRPGWSLPPSANGAASSGGDTK